MTGAAELPAGPARSSEPIPPNAGACNHRSKIYTLHNACVLGQEQQQRPPINSCHSIMPHGNTSAGTSAAANVKLSGDQCKMSLQDRQEKDQACECDQLPHGNLVGTVAVTAFAGTRAVDTAGEVQQLTQVQLGQPEQSNHQQDRQVDQQAQLAIEVGLLQHQQQQQEEDQQTAARADSAQQNEQQFHCSSNQLLPAQAAGKQQEQLVQQVPLELQQQQQQQQTVHGRRDEVQALQQRQQQSLSQQQQQQHRLPHRQLQHVDLADAIECEWECFMHPEPTSNVDVDNEHHHHHHHHHQQQQQDRALQAVGDAQQRLPQQRQQRQQQQQQDMPAALEPPAKKPKTQQHSAPPLQERQAGYASSMSAAAGASGSGCSAGEGAAVAARTFPNNAASTAAGAASNIPGSEAPGTELVRISVPAVPSDNAAAAAAEPVSAAAAAEGVMVNLDCRSCQAGTAEFTAAEERVDKTLEAYNKVLQKHHKQQRCKPDMIACSELREQHTPQPVHGHIPGIAVGQKFNGRGELAITGLHTAMMRGIMALRAAGKGGCVLPCFAIALSGGYKDDADTGSTFWYTGEGGQESKGGRQAKDQSYDSIGNAALLQSCKTQVPVRVFRSQPAPKLEKAAKGASRPWNPPIQIYEGLYRVKSHKMDVGADGMLVCKFEMQAIPGHSAVSTKVEYRCLVLKASFKRKQLAQPTAKPPAAQSKLPEPKSGRKRNRDIEAAAQKPPSGRKAKAAAAAAKPHKLLTRAEVEALVQQRAASGSYGRLVTADISGGLEKVPIPVFNAVDEDDAILMPFVQVAPAASAAATAGFDATSAAAAAASGDALSAAAAAVDSPQAADTLPGVSSSSGIGLDHVAADCSRRSSSLAAAPTTAAGVTTLVEGSCADDRCQDIAGVAGSNATAAAAAAAAASADMLVDDAEPQFTYIADYPLEHDAAVQELISAGDTAFKATYKGACGIRFLGSKGSLGLEETFNESGLLVYTQPSGILECGAKCRQTEFCKWNRVVSGGVRYPLEVFKVSAGKGWGVRCSTDMPAGAFVCCYIGLLRTDQQADKLIPGQEDRYLFDLSHFHEMWEAQQQGQLQEPINSNLAPLQGGLKDKHLVVDADNTGNVARFINHSCDPNCMIQAVLAGRARSQLLYYIAIVTQKPVAAGEELSYDYGEIYHSEVNAEVNGARFKFPCQCGAANCKGRIGSSTADS